MLVGPLRALSLLACLLALASWAAFAVDETRTGSETTQAEIEGSTAPAAADEHHGVVRRRLDEVARKLESPWNGLSDAAESLWVRETVPMLLALLVYGVLAGYLLRLVSLRR